MLSCDCIVLSCRPGAIRAGAAGVAIRGSAYSGPKRSVLLNYLFAPPLLFASSGRHACLCVIPPGRAACTCRPGALRRRSRSRDPGAAYSGPKRSVLLNYLFAPPLLFASSGCHACLCVIPPGRAACTCRPGALRRRSRSRDPGAAYSGPLK